MRKKSEVYWVYPVQRALRRFLRISVNIKSSPLAFLHWDPGRNWTSQELKRIPIGFERDSTSVEIGAECAKMCDRFILIYIYICTLYVNKNIYIFYIDSIDSKMDRMPRWPCGQGLRRRKKHSRGYQEISLRRITRCCFDRASLRIALRCASQHCIFCGFCR